MGRIAPATAAIAVGCNFLGPSLYPNAPRYVPDRVAVVVAVPSATNDWTYELEDGSRLSLSTYAFIAGSHSAVVGDVVLYGENPAPWAYPATPGPEPYEGSGLMAGCYRISVNAAWLVDGAVEALPHNYGGELAYLRLDIGNSFKNPHTPPTDANSRLPGSGPLCVNRDGQAFAWM